MTSADRWLLRATGTVSARSVVRKGVAQGDHQDEVVAMGVLRHLGATVGTSAGENGFTLGILYAREENIAAQCRSEAHALT